MSNILSIYCPGHADIMDSYGLVCCQLARYLTRMGVYVNLMTMGKRQMDSQDAELSAITAQPIKPSLGGVFAGYPTGYSEYTNPLAHIGPRVCITMFESSKLPQSWLEPLNSCDAVIVPSLFCADVFRHSGVTAPTYVVPLGIGELYQPQPRTEGRPFTFLSFLDRGLRKGGLQAVQAFVRAFGEDTDYHLILKSRTPKEELVLTNANMTVIQEDMTEQELYELYLRCDALINPNCGEGFGLIPREFAATGGIALATDWGGTADDIDLWGVPLPYTLAQAQWDGKSLRGYDLGVWAWADIEGCAAILRDVADRRESYRRRAMLASVYARTMYSWRDFAAKVLEIWEGVADARSERLPALAG